MILRELTLPNRPHLRVIRTTTSTNDDAREWAQEGAVDGATVVADNQTTGRGRIGRGWYSPPGVNLYLSQILRAPANRLRLIPLLGALASREAIGGQLPPELKAEIKWPNDILVHDRKVAGILSEMIPDPNSAGILGIGINLNLTEQDLPDDLRTSAGSLRMFIGSEINRREFLGALLEQLDKWRETFHNTPEDLVSSFIPHCITLGRDVQVIIPGREPFYGTARSIDLDGMLLVEDESGSLQRIEAGDVVISTAPSSSVRST